MKKFFVFVEHKGINSNKFYNMELKGDTIYIDYGRVGSTSTKITYPSNRWNSLISDKLRKGYQDITDLKTVDNVVVEDSGNKEFDEFFNLISPYVSSHIKNIYSVEGATKKQIEEAQKIIDIIVSENNPSNINDLLLSLFKTIPRRMSYVDDYLFKNNKTEIIQREQNNINSMNSGSIIHTTNPYKELDINFKKNDIPDSIKELIRKTNTTRLQIQNCYELNKPDTQFNEHVAKASNKNTEFLIHGTRVENVLNILKTGLLIRPSNAVYSGSVYGDGIYHSAHANKSFNYTGSTTDRFFLIQNVHMGNPYKYQGWYRDGKGLSSREMNHANLSKLGYDSVYVSAGDGLLNSEYIVYTPQQTVSKYLIHFK